LIKRFSTVRLLVVGDVVLDEYLWGDVRRISPEAPVPVLHVQKEATVLGGAGNVVRNVVALGGGCEFCAVIGDGSAGHRIVGLLDELGVDPGGMIVARDRPTIVKTRVVARSQQIVRFDRETEMPVGPRVRAAIKRAIAQRLPNVTGVILEDYGKGALTKPIIRNLLEQCVNEGLPVALDPKRELSSFRGVSLVKPNFQEAQMLTGISVRTESDLMRVCERLQRRLGGCDVVITRGSEGMVIFEGRELRTVPTPRFEVYDVQGAGDTTIAALVLALRAGASLLEGAVIANAAAGVVVRKTGTATACPEEVIAALPDALRAARGAL